MFRSSLLAYFLCLADAAVLELRALGMVTRRMLLLAAAGAAASISRQRVGVLVKQRINERVFRLIVLATIILVSISGLLKHLVF